jgi:F-type H+-transporting ATPase subunit gamma
MPSLIEVKSKISATRNTHKITKAMQLVATARMKQLQKTAISARNFAGELIRLWTDSLQGIEVPRWQAERPADGKKVFVLYSSDKGLCGGMNQQLIKTLINSSLWLDTPADQRIVVVFGRKGTDYLRFRKIPVDRSFMNLPDTLTPADAYGHIDTLLEYWDDKDVSAVYMVAPHYKNSFTFYPIVKQFLPITKEALVQHLGPNLYNESSEEKPAHKKQSVGPEQLVYFEPDKHTIAESVLENLANSLFIQAFYELKATEYSSRMVAMQNATAAAEKMIDEKTLLLNGIRQQRITQEIAEITGSAMVIN